MAPAFSSSPRKPTARSSAHPSSSSAHKSTVRRSSSPTKTPSRHGAASREVHDSPILDADLLESEGLMDGDESALLSFEGRGLEGLSLADSPMLPAAARNTTARQVPRLSASPGKARGQASWGPKASPSKGKMRLLDGLDEPASSESGLSTGTKKERTLGAMSYGAKGSHKARQSIFAKPAAQAPAASARQVRPSVGGSEGGEGDDSFYKDRALSASTTSVRERVAAMERAKEEAAAAEAAARTSPLKGFAKLPSADEQLDVQLAEIRRLNAVFSAYDDMLSGSADQIEDFTIRITETNALLDSYIDLMRQTDRTQQLLMDSDWRGVTEDEAMHALAIELAEREQRRRQEEAEEATRQAEERREQEQERARLAAEQAVAQQRGGSRTSMAPASMRGSRGGAVRGSGIPTRGTVSSRARGAAVGLRGRAASTGAAPRSASGTTRPSASTTESGGGLGNRYANVRSSGYGPR